MNESLSFHAACRYLQLEPQQLTDLLRRGIIEMDQRPWTTWDKWRPRIGMDSLRMVVCVYGLRGCR